MRWGIGGQWGCLLPLAIVGGLAAVVMTIGLLLPFVLPLALTAGLAWLAVRLLSRRGQVVKVGHAVKQTAAMAQFRRQAAHTIRQAPEANRQAIGQWFTVAESGILAGDRHTVDYAFGQIDRLRRAR